MFKSYTLTGQLLTTISNKRNDANSSKLLIGNTLITWIAGTFRKNGHRQSPFNRRGQMPEFYGGILAVRMRKILMR